MNDEALIDMVIKTLNEAGALDMKVFEVGKLTSIADYMIIVSGQSSRQVSAMADKLTLAAKQHKQPPLGVEGKDQGQWALVDLGDIIVHIMQPETRAYYQLEKLWGIEAGRAETL